MNKTTKPGIRGIEEFVCVWFESQSKWVAILSSGHVIDHGFGGVGYAVNAVYTYLGRGEAEFDCTADTGEFYRYEKNDEFWGRLGA